MTKRYYKYGETHRKVRGRKQKYCTKCKKWKSVSEFGKDCAKRDGLNIRCKNCYKAYTRALHKKYRKGKKVRVYLRFEERHRILKGVRQKLCTKYGKWKKESEYYKHRSNKDGLSERCNKCSYKPAKKSRKRRSAVKD